MNFQTAKRERLQARTAYAAEALPGDAQVAGQVRDGDFVQVLRLFVHQLFVSLLGRFGQRLDDAILQYNGVTGQEEVYRSQVFFPTQLFFKGMPWAPLHSGRRNGYHREVRFFLAEEKSRVAIHITGESETKDKLPIVNLANRFKNAALDVEKEIVGRIGAHHDFRFLHARGFSNTLQGSAQIFGKRVVLSIDMKLGCKHIEK